MSETTIPPELISDGWKRACEFWGTTLDIAAPVDIAARQKSESIAYIELETRQVSYNSAWFLQRKLLDCFPAVFAHELAHHMRYPHTLRVSAELMLLGNRISPGLDWSMINLFLDLLVNEHVGRDPELRRELIKMYTVIASETEDDLYRAYLCVYESLWFGEAEFGLRLNDPTRALIRSFTDTFYQLANVYEQFIYFLYFFLKYFPVPKNTIFLVDPLTGDSRVPGVDDFPVDGSWTKAMRDAYKRAADEKWSDGARIPANSDESFGDLASVMRQLAGKGQPLAPQQAALRYYRSLIEHAIDELPLKLSGEKEPLELPSTREEWQFDDDPRSIDWVESVLNAGEMAAATPLKREVFVEPSPELSDADLGIPDFEIYLDTSGSMPNPVGAVNPMTLAALVLSTYAVRKGGRVYGVVYSSGKPIISKDWMLEEQGVQTFFLNYFGGGTDYPFDILQERSEKYPGTFRIIISDSDFISNVLGRGATDKKAILPNIKLIREAADRSKALILLFHNVNEKMMKDQKLGTILNHPRVRLVTVTDGKKFAAIAAQLAQALLGAL